MFEKLRTTLHCSPFLARVILILFLFGLLPPLTLVSQQITKLESMSAGSASLSFIPTSTTLPPNTTLQLTLNAGTSTVSFVKVEVTFDPNSIRLVDETTPIQTATAFQRIIVKTPKSEANASGRVVLALGVDPGASLPTGVVTLASLPFTLVTTLSNQTTTISINDSEVEIVDQAATLISLTPTIPAVLTLNPQPSPSPILVSPSPTPLPTDITPPTITITNPVNGAIVTRNSIVTISTTASDNVGVTKVEFRVNNSFKCSDATFPYSCTWKVTGKPNIAYTLEAKTYDAAANTGVHAISVTSSGN